MKLNVYFLKKLIRNKYFLVGMAFLVLLFINERNSILDQISYRKSLQEAKEKHAYYSKEIERVKKEKEELFGNRKNLEKFAREKYLMKADNEDVFVMIEEKE